MARLPAKRDSIAFITDRIRMNIQTAKTSIVAIGEDLDALKPLFKTTEEFLDHVDRVLGLGKTQVYRYMQWAKNPQALLEYRASQKEKAAETRQAAKSVITDKPRARNVDPRPTAKNIDSDEEVAEEPLVERKPRPARSVAEMMEAADEDPEETTGEPLCQLHRWWKLANKLERKLFIKEITVDAPA